MLESNKYIDILGDIDCQSDDTSENMKCPLWSDEGPTLDEVTGEYTCPLCFMSLGFQIDDSVGFIDDDPDDEDPSSQPIVVREADNKDWTSIQQQQVAIRRAIDEVTSVIAKYDVKLAYKLSETNFQYEIVNKVRTLRRNKVPLFTGGDFKPMILAVALHILSKEIPSKAYQELRGVKVDLVMDMRRALRLIDNPDENSELESNFVMIGRKTDIPEAIVSAALESYMKRRLPNEVDNPKALVCAWLFLEAKRMGAKTTKKVFYENIPGVSPTLLRKAIQSYTLALGES